MRRAALAFGLAVALSACATAASGLTAAWTGVYKRTFMNGMVSGEAYEATDSITITRISNRSAAVVIALEFYNGHQCGFREIFQVEGESLVYRERGTPEHGERCVMTITRENGAMVLNDPGGACANGTCGMRGSYNGVRIPIE